MDLFEEFRRLVGGVDKEIDDKIVDLAVEDSVERDTWVSKSKAFRSEMERLNLLSQELDLENKMWWVRMRQKYKIALDKGLYYSEGSLWEWKQK